MPRIVPIVAIVAGLLFSAACDESSPTAPSSRIPEVAGTYTGTVYFSGYIRVSQLTNCAHKAVS